MTRSWFPTAAAPDPRLTSVARAHRNVQDLASWVADHWASWAESAVRIVFIVVVAFVLRAMLTRLITRLIDRMNRASAARPPLALGGLLVNAERRRQRSEAIGSVLRSMASFVILGTGALTVLSVLKINLAPLLASAGVAGVAVGFGARNLVTDFLSGVFMILEDQYGVGDVIDAGVASGTVIEVGLRVTKLRGADGQIWYVRNGEVQRIGNQSQGWSVATVDFQVGYGQDLDRARELIAQAAAAMGKEAPWDEKLWEPVQVLGLASVEANCVVIQAQVKTMPGEASGAVRELRWRVKQAFDEHDVQLMDLSPVPGLWDPADFPGYPLPAAAVAGSLPAPERPSHPDGTALGKQAGTAPGTPSGTSAARRHAREDAEADARDARGAGPASPDASAAAGGVLPAAPARTEPPAGQRPESPTGAGHEPPSGDERPDE